jgi:hypothetical protein
MSLSQLSRLMAMSDAAKVKRTLAAQVEQRVKSGLCLVCESQAVRRGLCMNHYQMFLRRMRDRDGKSEQLNFEASCIYDGKILPVHEMRKIKQDDPFANV